ncbi:hypothetical protein [Owenweeksia hongkongensis]|uniref:hypothetical protein n=1 Tax=Owenweeksia hongkongensis TaxID=253245 RepID=UPI003A8EF435
MYVVKVRVITGYPFFFFLRGRNLKYNNLKTLLKNAAIAAALFFCGNLFAQSPHSEITLGSGINQARLDYAFLFGETRRHIIEAGFVLGSQNINVDSERTDGVELLYHYVINADDKFDFSTGFGLRVGGEARWAYISIPLTLRYKMSEYFRLRARLTNLVGGDLDVKVMPTIGFGVAF